MPRLKLIAWNIAPIWYQMRRWAGPSNGHEGWHKNPLARAARPAPLRAIFRQMTTKEFRKNTGSLSGRDGLGVSVLAVRCGSQAWIGIRLSNKAGTVGRGRRRREARRVLRVMEWINGMLFTISAISSWSTSSTTVPDCHPCSALLCTALRRTAHLTSTRLYCIVLIETCSRHNGVPDEEQAEL